MLRILWEATVCLARTQRSLRLPSYSPSLSRQLELQHESYFRPSRKEAAVPCLWEPFL
jgi:hypothetical protein